MRQDDYDRVATNAIEAIYAIDVTDAADDAFQIF